MSGDLLTRFTNALDCCGTCAGGALAKYTRDRVADALEDAASDPDLRLSGHSGVSITRLRQRASALRNLTDGGAA